MNRAQERDPRDLVAPRLRPGHRRRVGEPERARLGDVKALGPEQDRRVLALLRAIVAAHADDGVAADGGEDLVDLEVEGLLQAEEIRPGVANHLEEHVAPRRPLVLAVLGGAVADVEGHHRQWLARLDGHGRRRLWHRIHRLGDDGGRRQHEGEQQWSGPHITFLSAAAAALFARPHGCRPRRT